MKVGVDRNRQLEKMDPHQCLFSNTLAPMQLPDGLYDRLVTESLSQLIAGLRDPSYRTLSTLPSEQAAERITDALARQVTQLLDEIEGNGADKPKQQLALVNALLVHLRQQVAGNLDPLIEPPQILQAVHRIGVAPKFPETGLAMPWLFTSRAKALHLCSPNFAVNFPAATKWMYWSVSSRSQVFESCSIFSRQLQRWALVANREHTCESSPPLTPARLR